MKVNRYIQVFIRLLIFILIQVFLLQNIQLKLSNALFVPLLCYPIGILFFPVKTPHVLMVIIGFAVGLLMDAIYNTPGVHAGALTFACFIREYVLRILEPREGYSLQTSPTILQLGLSWFLKYSIAFILIFSFAFFTLETFTFVFMGKIIIKTLVSSALTFIFLIIYKFTFNPEI